MFKWTCPKCGELKESDYPYKDLALVKCSRCEWWFTNPYYDRKCAPPLRKDEGWYGDWDLEKHPDGWYCCDHGESLGDY